MVVTNHAFDFLRGRIDVRRQSTNLISDDGKTPPVSTGSGRFYSSIQRQQVSLIGNLADRFYPFTDMKGLHAQIGNFTGNDLR